MISAGYESGLWTCTAARMQVTRVVLLEQDGRIKNPVDENRTQRRAHTIIQFKSASQSHASANSKGQKNQH